jgi:hypothetical protein
MLWAYHDTWESHFTDYEGHSRCTYEELKNVSMFWRRTLCKALHEMLTLKQIKIIMNYNWVMTSLWMYIGFVGMSSKQNIVTQSTIDNNALIIQKL